jgi:hypothetical protein
LAGEDAAHALEKAPTLGLGRPGIDGVLQLFDARIGALERLLLEKDRLHQRVDRVWCTREPVADRALGIGIALPALERPEAVEQVGDHLSFLRSHVPLLWPDSPARSDMGSRGDAGSGRDNTIQL